MRIRTAAVSFAALLSAAGAVDAQAPRPAGPQASLPATPGPSSGVILLSPEGNRLNAYDTGSLAKQNVIPSVGDAAAGPDPTVGRDINAQICAHRLDGEVRFISGEDSQDDAGQKPGWGYFVLEGSEVGSLGWDQIGKLAPAAYRGAPDNFGCGFLSNGTLVTTAIGDIFPGEPASGELILWFPDAEGGFTQGFVESVNSEGGAYTTGNVPYCKLDVRLATPGGIYVGLDENGRDTIYVAANRPDDDGHPGGVFRYAGDFPTSPDAAGGCGGTIETDGVAEPFVTAGRITKELFVPSLAGAPADPLTLTPSSAVGSGRLVGGRETLYVSSVFTGTIAEYDAEGNFLRNVLLPPGPVPVGQLTGITPFGLAVDAEGTLYVADLGIVGPTPVPFFGSVVRVRFVDPGVLGARPVPLPPETVDNGLTFPDGLGLVPPL